MGKMSGHAGSCRASCIREKLEVWGKTWCQKKCLPTILSSSIPFVYPFLKNFWKDGWPTHQICKKPHFSCKINLARPQPTFFLRCSLPNSRFSPDRKFQRSSLRGENLEISVMSTPQKSPKHAWWFKPCPFGMVSSRDPELKGYISDLQLGDEKVTAWITWCGVWKLILLRTFQSCHLRWKGSEKHPTCGCVLFSDVNHQNFTSKVAVNLKKTYKLLNVGTF